MDYFNYFSLNISKAEILVGAIIFIVNSFLGILIFSRNPRSWTNRFFFMLVVTLNAYIVVNYLSLHPARIEDQLLWIKVVMFTAAFMGPLLFMLAHTFPGEKILLKMPYRIAVIMVALLSAGFSLAGYVFKSLTYAGGRPLPVPGPAMPPFFIGFVYFIFLSFIVLLLRYKKLKDQEKIQEKYFLFGIVASFTLITLVTIISVVILKNSNLVVLGPIFSIVMIAPIAYAIVRYQLFNIKIIATNLLIIVVWIILGSKLFIPSSSIEFSMEFIVLLLTIIFGILLIKSVRKEVKQREKLEILTKELGAANDKLKALDKVKSEFLSFASHQVKAPMAAVKGFASLIFDGTYGVIPEAVKEAAKRIQGAADRMIALVNNILNLRRIEEGKMEYKMIPLKFGEMLSEIVEGLRPLAIEKKVALTLEKSLTEETVIADYQKLGQVFQNLIENAIKYTNQGGVTIEVKTADNREVTVQVKDTGQGMSAETLERIFEPFSRGQATAVATDGTGLGLFIAKQIVLAHQGKIRAESKGEGQGSIFTVVLPLAKTNS